MYFDSTKLLAIICIAYVWSLLDKVRWNYPTTVFSRLGGEKLQSWLDPSKSQGNKHIFKNRVLEFIFTTSLVWVTDLWHLIKLALLFTIFYFIYKFKPDQKLWIELLIMFIIYGAVFEMNYQMNWFWWLKKKTKK
jgi:hypothetical protein